VSDSLKQSGNFNSDQGAIWDGIQELSASAEIHSPTAAMKDVFEGKKNNLEKYMKAFQVLPHQNGMWSLWEEGLPDGICFPGNQFLKLSFPSW